MNLFLASRPIWQSRSTDLNQYSLLIRLLQILYSYVACRACRWVLHIVFSFHFGKPPALLASDSGPYDLSLDGFAGSTTLEVVAVSI